MSEAELHLLRSRLRGGILNKARRGELTQRSPVGLVPDGRCCARSGRRDPDQHRRGVRSLHHNRQRCRHTASADASGIRYPQRAWGGENAGTVLWCDYTTSRVRNVLTNPAYASAYVYGRRRCRMAPNGQIDRRTLAPQDWIVVIPDRSRAISHGLNSRPSGTSRTATRKASTDPARSARRARARPMQSRVMCSQCGSPMYVRYGSRQGHRPRPRYVCVDKAAARRAACRSVPTVDVDAAVARLLLELMTPMAVEMTLAIQNELGRIAESEHHPSAAHHPRPL
ncbi:recombinase zinc beta ribbon domain-containing protein [Mesorhizobium amorphae]|uniref:Recombinase n=1 Tax=Mesorhizobium amorphae CCNWGS0123 TaxID=1082933 RepID=G6YMD1_9HYPH|nr:recombinase zinc beta ribbon domain-containing protein [Mesorhizobium amorphae]ANT54504.1 hypothetical protein A6B35_31220 [Mesorhizobium amorphae CCNWGS0123]EHH02139.1 recombinase [Mesorhizobium amorphae CCNWGS0123]